MKSILRITAIFALIILLLMFGGCVQITDHQQSASPKGISDFAQQQTDSVKDLAQSGQDSDSQQDIKSVLDENGVFTSKDDVALYIIIYGRLPKNFITKNQARALGWAGGDLRPYAPDFAIGGDRFSNYEGLLPKKKGRNYFECDIDTLGKSSRGAKRIVYSNDGLIYYTDDHYKSFVKLYGGD